MSILTYIHACMHGWHISKYFVPFCILEVLQDYKLMRQIDEDALHELNIKMRSFLDNVAEINHVHGRNIKNVCIIQKYPMMCDN